MRLLHMKCHNFQEMQHTEVPTSLIIFGCSIQHHTNRIIREKESLKDKMK